MRFVSFGLSVASLLLATAGTAWASASLTCSIKDKTLQLDLQGTISHGGGSGLISAEGNISPNIPLLTGDMGTFTVGRDDITQYWLGPQELKLRIYRESAGSPHQTLEIAIDTRRKGDADGINFAGTYSGSATSMAGVTEGEAKSVAIKGKATCQLE